MIKRRHVASSSSSSSTLPTSSSSSSGAGADHDVHAGHPPSSSSHNDHGGGNKDDDGNADGRVVDDDDDGTKKGAAPRGGTATAAAAIAAVDVARRSSRPIVGMAFLLVVACLVGVMVTGGDYDDGGGTGGGTGGGNFDPASRRGDARRRRRGPPGRVRGGGGSGSREEAEVLGRISAPEADGPAVVLPRGAAGGGHGQRQHGQRVETSAEADAAPHQPADDPPSQQQSQQRQLQFDDLAESIRSIRSQFETRYGGADAAYSMLRRGIRTFDPPPPSSDGGGGGSEAANDSSESSTSAAARARARARRHTALRILRSASHPDPTKRTFVAAFGGYSVTVGRGNLFAQSFPFVMERILHEPLSKLGVELVVRNAAIGGIPSFPYGWCLPNFLGDDADLISWDYGMNEGNDAVGLEAYIRHGMNLPKRPMVVVLDTKKSRMDLMRKYVELGALVDPVVVSREDDVVDRALLERKEEDRPEGLTRWDEWGAPRGSPGQSPWHPKFREHELMGWNLAVHLLEAVEEAGRIMRDEPGWRDKYGGQGRGDGEEELPPILLPPPQNEVHSSAQTILHGTERIEDDDKWYMNPVSCRTTFLPVVSGSMTSIILSGVAELDDEDGEGDAMKSRPDSKYETGWVLDVGKVERDTKRKVERVGGGTGMGYVDMKLALYGIPGSGPVRFWLPYEGRRRRGTTTSSAASDWFDTVVVCEVNEKRGPGECRMGADVTYTVGGAKSSRVSKLRSVASYLKKEVCVAVPVPPDARITRRKDLASLLDGEESATATTSVLNGGDGDDVGIVLEVQVTGKTVSRKEGACSISHVVWEQH